MINFTFTQKDNDKNYLTFEKFLELLKKEEDYFPDKHDTQIMITRLRKIFYDNFSWNTELLKGTGKTKGRYKTLLVPDKEKGHKKRKVIITEKDKYNKKKGETPEIYNKKEVLLPDLAVCDLGHTLAGLDCYVNPRIVSPLSHYFMYGYKHLPYGNRNMDLSTWLGDLAATCGEIIFNKIYIKNKINDDLIQKIIDVEIPPADLLGDIDAYVIGNKYNVKKTKSILISEIFDDYYNNKSDYIKNRFGIYAKQIGLKWNGKSFDNKDNWIQYYTKQLRSSTIFYIGTRFPFPGKYTHAIKTWFKNYDSLARFSIILKTYLENLKQEILKES